MSAHTPGPWRWEVSLKSKQIQLCGGVPRYDLTVMDFVRWGMGGARPRFLREWAASGMMVMEYGEAFARVVPGREHHADWFQTLNHPDANLIAAAPDMLAALREVAHHADDECGFMALVRDAIAKAEGQS